MDGPPRKAAWSPTRVSRGEGSRRAGRRGTMDDVEAVNLFLRGQNLEQIGRVDEAADLYEQAVAARFDSAGPYDRLIAIYAGRARHGDVVRVARGGVRDGGPPSDKRAWDEGQE